VSRPAIPPPSIPVRTSGWLLGLLSALLAGCTVPATQLLVAIDTDFFVPAELDTIRVRVLYASDAEGAPDEARPFATPPPLEPGETEVVIGGLAHAVRRTLDIALAPAGTLPFELSLVPADGDERRVARIEAYGLRDGVVRAVGSVRTRFVRHRTTRVPLFVFVACSDIECPPDTTCGAGGACVPNEVEPGCLEDPRLCPDAPQSPPDAGPPDVPAVCGDGLWAPLTEECDGSDDCDDGCRLLVPPVDACSSQPLLTGPFPLTVEGVFRGAPSRRRSPCSSSFASGREVVYAIDADLETPLRVTVLTEGMTLTVSPECPASTSGSPYLRGACAGPRRETSPPLPVWLGEGPVDVVFMNGRLFLMVDEADPSDYERAFAFRIEEALPPPGAGTCADPYEVPGSLLLGLGSPRGDELRAEASSETSCPAGAGADVWIALPDPFAERRATDPDQRTGLYYVVTSSDDEVVETLMDQCGSMPSRGCSRATPVGGPQQQVGIDFPGATGDRRVVVDGILPETQWIGLSLDARF
jgi:hypothetical protein